MNENNIERENSMQCETVGTAVTDRVEVTDKSNDPYAYLERSEFTSEKFKIEIRNLPKYYGFNELKKLLKSKLNLNPTKIKTPAPKGGWSYVCFKSEEEKATALKILNGYTWKKQTLIAQEAKAVPDPLVKKRNLKSSDSNISSKRVKLDVKDLLEQLESKNNQIRMSLKKFSNELIKANPELSKWCKQQESKYNNLPCELLPIRHSNVINGYRNKCEFSIGINESTGERTVGFRLGSYVEGSVSVGPIDEVLNVPETMKIAAKSFEKFVQNSKYDVFSPELHKGYWKQLTVRYGFRTNELMLIVGLDPQQLTSEELCNLKNDIEKYFKEGDGSSCPVHSLYLQQIKKRKSQDDVPALEHVFGETYITEKILGKTFRISPQAFFQVNSNATDILYESIGELAGLKNNVTLLDVCCGTGTIGLCLAEKCNEVLGLEMTAEAIADARVNADLNGVKNAEFFVGKAEDVLSSVAYKAKNEEIVAIVDPPRAGLPCDHRKAVKNFVDLGRATSKIYKGEPFLPVKAIPVDLFPHTPHCELITYFER
ncbi:hypothetical protein RUM43_005551 [Polyplax serrata]|uniref:tRNA (uracil(54)-C(5))-methyltransferase n=1 Tax=Polyplax serrata TaxID=468196 RepID=A0AAN8S4U9_POLSC